MDRSVKYSPAGKKSRQNRCLFAVIALLVLLLIILLILVIVYGTQYHNLLRDRNDSERCTSPACVEVAGRTLEVVDLEANPCQDFYTYACGSFLRDSLLEPDQEVIDAGGPETGRRVVDNRLVKLLGEPGTRLRGKHSEALRKAKAYYKACLDEAQIEEAGATPFNNLIRNTGGWRLSGGYISPEIDLEDLKSKVHFNQMDPFFTLRITPDIQNRTTSIIEFVPPSTQIAGGRHVSEDEEKYREAFYELMRKLVTLLGEDPDSKVSEIATLWEIEKELAQAALAHFYTNQVEITKMNLSRLQTLLGPPFNLNEYIEKVFERDIPMRTDVIVTAPDFFREIQDILQSHSKADMLDFIVWRKMFEMLPYGARPFREARQAWEAAALGERAPHQLPEYRCAEWAKVRLTRAVAALYDDTYHDKTVHDDVMALLHRIKETLREEVKDLSWMEARTKRKTLEKLEHLREYVGLVEGIIDITNLDAAYKNYDPIVPDDLFHNELAIVEATTKDYLAKLNKYPSIYDILIGNSLALNSLYLKHINSLIIHPEMTIFLYSRFDTRFPPAMMYGATGSRIATEFIHIFDSTGKFYGKTGGYGQWWDSATSRAFDEKTQCFVDQYEGLQDEEALGDAIADAAGVELAYKAYRKWVDEHGGHDFQSQLPGLNVTSDQLFFIAFATPFCSKEKSGHVSPRTQDKRRVLTALRNFETFAQVYDCPERSRMNPERRCSLW